MSLLKKLKPTTEIKEQGDSVGGARLLESNIYPVKIDVVYLTEAESGAVALNFVGTGENKEEIKGQMYVQSGRDKGSKSTYTDKDGNEQGLPGYHMANHLALLTVGKEISELDTEEKVIKIYNYDAKAEVPTKVQVVTELIGQEILVAVLKQTVDKQKKGDDGQYHNTGETRDQNDIDKFFRAKDKMTVSEIKAQAEAPVFYETWKAKWAGKTQDKSKGGSGNTGKAGAPAATGGTAKPKTSLFGN